MKAYTDHCNIKMSIKIMLIVFISTAFHKILTTAVALCSVNKKNRRYPILEKSLLFSIVQIKAESLKATSSFTMHVLIIANVFHKCKKIPV